MSRDLDAPITRRVEHAWGTAITVEVRDAVRPSTIDEVFRSFRRVDEMFSTWRDDSEVNRLARDELGLSDASPDVRAVLGLCDEVKKASYGAFDVRVGADPRVSPREGLGRIDPSGIVKGWALARAGEFLRRHDATNFAINAGGDVLTAGESAPGAPWRVGIQNPWKRDKVAAVVETYDAGIATSGRYERGDHVIDPRTAAPARELMAVTVVGPDLALADAYATAALVMGADGARWLTDEMRVAAMTIGNDGTVTLNDAFARLRAP